MSKKIHSAILVDPVVVGKICAAYGIYGWMRLLSSTEQVAENIFAYQPWFIKSMSKWQNIILEKWKRHNHNLIIKLRNINDRKAAMLLINCDIVIDGSQLPELDSGEYYWKDIFGCCVVTINGYQLGKVINIIETGSNDVLVVKDNFKQDDVGIKELLIPFIEGQVIKNVDLSVRIIKVDWDPSF